MHTKPVYAFPAAPSAERLAPFLAQNPGPKHLVFGLNGRSLPDWHAPDAEQGSLKHKLHQALARIQFSGCTYLPEFLDNCDLRLLPENQMAHLADYFGGAPVFWIGDTIPQLPAAAVKPWLMPPAPQPISGRVLVVGAGLAGAATAYELARRGVKVCVLEAADRPAAAASGSRQGLVYAKISARPTAQTELLLSGYGYTLHLLHTLLPEQQDWSPCGVLHLNHNEAERKRNAELAAHDWHRHLYYGVDAAQAGRLAGIPMSEGGLFWPQGAWVHPAAFVRALLEHPNIETRYRSPVRRLNHTKGRWTAHSDTASFSGSHLVLCCGADSRKLPLLDGFPFVPIRGQTSLAAAVSGSLKLKTALSGAAYIAPAWQGLHCYGATFLPQDGQADWRAADEAANRASLHELTPFLADAFTEPVSGSPNGHAAVRCDTFDHLPALGALGDAAAMRLSYAKLARDKNYRLDTPCPYLPNAYLNTAHGSRGLATAPICAAQLAAEICADAAVLSAPLRRALSPNRLVIRQIVRGRTDQNG